MRIEVVIMTSEIVGYIINDLKSPTGAANLLDEIEKCYQQLRKKL